MAREKDIINDYFNWMCSLVCDKKHSKQQYKKLLITLHNVNFTYLLECDDNRAYDGIYLRYRYALEQGDMYLYSVLGTGDCSVLEMMVALSMRCEDQIMDNPDIGNRTSHWFWTMINSLGVNHMTNDIYDKQHVIDILNTFLTRNYKENGEGGLFIVDNCEYDLREAEIWEQMCWYLNTIL